MQLNKVIHAPIITEKALADKASHNRYTFRVNRKATKGSISDAVHELFNVEVLDVRTSIIVGKPKRLRRTSGVVKTATWKKAIVTLKKGQKIDLFPEE